MYKHSQHFFDWAWHMQVSNFLALSMQAAAKALMLHLFPIPADPDLPATATAWQRFDGLPDRLCGDVLHCCPLPLALKLRLSPLAAHATAMRAAVTLPHGVRSSSASMRASSTSAPPR